MKVGDLVRLTQEPHWGVGIVTSKRGMYGHGGFYAYFAQINDFYAICDVHFENQRVEVISESR